MATKTDLFSNLDLNLQELLNARVENLDALPSASASYKGRLVINTTNNTLYYCDGSAWIPITANTDTKVTAVGNHYAPSGTTVPTLNTASTPTTDTVAVISQVKGDAKGHVVSQDRVNVPTKKYIDDQLTALGSALKFKGTIGTGGTVTALPNSHNVGDVYLVKTAGTHAGQSCEVGDMLICTTTGTSANNDHWSVAQANWTAVAGSSALSWNTETTLATIGGITIKAKLPANPNTDTKVTSEANHYTPSANSDSQLTASASGATAAWSIDVVKAVTVSRDSKGHVTGVSVISGKIPANPNTDTHYTTHLYAGDGTNAKKATTNGNTKITVVDNTTARDAVTIKGTGATTVVSDANNVITINSTNTTYDDATTSTHGLMTASDKEKLNSITTGANRVTVFETSALTGTSGTITNHNLHEVHSAEAYINGKKCIIGLTINGTDVSWESNIAFTASQNVKIRIIGC